MEARQPRQRGELIASSPRLMFVTLTAVPTESAAGQVARLVWSFPRCACARATLGAQSVRRPGCNAGPLGFYGRPQRAGPAQSPPDQDSRERHRGVAPAPATSANYTMPRNTSSGADHFRAVATMMRDVTFPPVTTHHNTSIQRKRFAAVQGSSRSPLMKKGSMSLYSRIFTVVPLGALPCAIARACSDCATIARARSFLWIE